MSTSTSPSCPYCSREDLRYLGHLPHSHWFAGRLLPEPLIGGTLYLCNTCKLKFRFPIHSQSIYRNLYDNSISNTWSADLPRRDWGLIVNHITANLPAGTRVLDFGCYTGGLLARLEERYECHGVEINTSAATIAKQREKSNIWATLDDIPTDMQFDAIIACDVVEHMPDPGSFINTLSSRLAKRGRLIITTGDAKNSLWEKFGANWWYCFYPEHISFISEAWIDFFSQHSRFSKIIYHTFRYHRLAAHRYVIDFLLATVYGLFPNFYLQMIKPLQKAKHILKAFLEMVSLPTICLSS